MAKRRKKKKDDPVIVLLTYFMFGAAAAAWYLSKSAFVGFLVFSLLLIGYVVIQMLIIKKKRERLKRSGIADIDEMDGRQFEHYLGVLFQTQGYKCEVTQSSGDYGADLVIRKDGSTIVVQAKRYKGNIGVKAVQEVQAAIAHYKANEAWVVTNSNFTQQAITLANSNQVRLIGREDLIEMILKLNPESTPSPKEVIIDVPYESKTCKSCGSSMVIKNSRYGKFWGCTNYPTCSHTVNLK